MNDLQIFYVYFHITKDTNEIFYIGKGKNRRAFEKNSRNKYWHNIVNKHGYIVEFIKENLTENESLSIEIDLIAKHKPKANMSTGGRGGCTGIKRSADDLRRRSETQRRQRSSPEWKAMNSAIQKEVQNRPDVVAKRTLGKQIYLQQIKDGLIACPWKGLTRSDETKKRISDAQKGENGYWYGKITAVAKKVINLDTNEVFQSLKKAAESVDGGYRALSKAIKAGRKFKKVRFAYV